MRGGAWAQNRWMAATLSSEEIWSSFLNGILDRIKCVGYLGTALFLIDLVDVPMVLRFL